MMHARLVIWKALERQAILFILSLQEIKKKKNETQQEADKIFKKG